MKGEEILEFFETPVTSAEVGKVLRGLRPRDATWLRDEAVKRYGFSIPCREAVALLSSFSPLLELGAGSGYWARILRAAGADVVATDVRDGSSYSKLWGGGGVAKWDAAEAVDRWPDRNVFVSWPSNGLPWCAEAARRVRSGRTLAYMGEGRGGCTADASFFDVLDEMYDEAGTLAIPAWPDIHDFMGIYVRR